MTERALGRRRLFDEISLSSSTSQHLPKKQKLQHPEQPPASFWDNLSEIPLTRNALRELDRRNAEGTQDSRKQTNGQTGGRITRRVVAQWKADQQSATDILSPGGLTRRKRIVHSARHGGPELSDLRNYPPPVALLKPGMSSSQSGLGRRKRRPESSKSQNTPNTTTTKSMSPYDRAFQQHLIDHGVFPEGYEYPNGDIPPEPENMEEIRRALAQPRPSLSPSRFSNEDFRKFKRADAHAAKERQVTTSVIPIIEGDIGDTKCVAGEVPFTNLDHLTDGSLVPGNPDLYYGARPEQLDRRVRIELNNLIVPSTQHDLPIAPNFFLAVKGPDGSAAVAERQACYDGVLGARGIDGLRSRGEARAIHDNKARVMTCTYYAGALKMYASHPVESTTRGAQPEYVMTQVKAFAVTSDVDTFRQGAAAYRNGRDWAKRQRDEVIMQANVKAAIRIQIPLSSQTISTWPVSS